MSERPYDQAAVDPRPGGGGDMRPVTGGEALENLVAEELAEVVLGARLVGDGGRGGLWQDLRAREPRSGRPCLLRVRTRHRGDEEMVARVLQAARQDASATHSSMISLHRFGCTDHLLWVTLRVDPTGRLGDGWLEDDRAPSTARALEFLRRVTAPVLAVHGEGLVHGALTPSAFRRDLEGTWRICCGRADVQVLRADYARGVESDAISCSSPEVRLGTTPSPASDQYSVAAMFVRFLCGRYPGPGGELPRGTLPGTWATKLRRALAQDPRGRFPAIGDLLEALEARLADGSTSRRKAGGRGPLSAPTPRQARGRTPGRARPRLLVFVEGAGRDGPAMRPEVSPRRRVVGAAALVALSAVLASAQVGSPREIAATLSATATKGEAQWSRLTGRGASPAGVSAAPLATPAVRSSPASPVASGGGSPSPSPGTSAPGGGAGPVPAPLAPGRLSLQSQPWASVFVDGVYVGTSPLLDLPIRAGAHVVRVERPDLVPYSLAVTVDAGQELRLTGIVLDRKAR